MSSRITAKTPFSGRMYLPDIIYFDFQAFSFSPAIQFQPNHTIISSLSAKMRYLNRPDCFMFFGFSKIHYNVIIGIYTYTPI